MQHLWMRIRRIGITDDMSVTDARYYELANAITAVGAAIQLAFMPIATASDSALMFGENLVFCASFFGAFALRARGLHWAATTFLSFAAVLHLGLGGTVIYGTVSGLQHLLMVGLVVPYLLYPRQHVATAHVVAVTYLVTYLAILFGPPVEGAVPEGLVASVEANFAAMGVCMLALGIYERRVVANAEAQLENEKARSDRLLLNVLPQDIAERLKEGENPIADAHEDATVLFADIVNFTPLSATLSASALVERLNAVFTSFDSLAAKHGLEKIKTIGDAYMVAGGVPSGADGHAQAVARMALEMRAAISDFEGADGLALEVRIGLHSGPLVAGVIGTHKFAYDLWGDTVNTASRMESHGEPGKIHVSEAVVERLEDGFEVEKREPITVRGKGEMQTYWLDACVQD